MSLPSGYKRLEYIKSSGTQYIDSGIQPTQNTRIDLKVSTTQTGSHTIAGSDISWTGNGFSIGVGFAHYGTGMLPDGVPFWAFLIFQTVFCATSATIVSGAMAERTKFLSYCVYSLMISLVVYPVSGHWIWGGGFISQMGFHDFAGSCAIHMVGGISALIGAKILGPRIGKFTKDKSGKITKVNAFPGRRQDYRSVVPCDKMRQN